MMKRFHRVTAICASAGLLLTGCSLSGSDSTAPTGQPVQQTETTVQTESSTVSEETAPSESKTQSIDYLTLVNKLNPLPDDWEDSIETVHCTNSLGDDVEVEKKAYDAYLALKADLEEDGVFVDLDSARRSIEEQERIMKEFTEQYGADYAAKIVATPGYSEHHTGLALDLYLVIDGVDVYLNEDMEEYPEIWAKIHEKLAGHGFILRYLEDKEHITGYAYEPWHLRYIDDADAAKEITEKGITLEEYLNAVSSADVTVDYGSSERFSEEELKEAAVQVKCKFATFKGCELHSLRYAGDESSTEDSLARIRELDDTADYVEVVEFLTDFHTSEGGSQELEPDTEMTDYPWWLAREKDGGWQLIVWGE